MHQLFKYMFCKAYLPILVAFFMHFSNLNAQIAHIKSMKNWELKGYGKAAERAGDVYATIDYYAEYFKRKPSDYKTCYKLAKLYFDINDFSKAKLLFKKVMKKSSNKYPHSLYYLAEILRIESKYDSAMNLYSQYQEKMRKKRGKNLFYYMSDIRIESCIYAANNTLQNKKIEVKHLNSTINKAHMESSPIIINDSVFIYSSLAADSVPLVGFEDKNDRPFQKFYQAVWKNETWQGGRPVSSEPFFSYDSLGVPNGAFSEDNKRFYFTLSHQTKYGKKVSYLYVSKKNSNGWSTPEKLPGKVNEKGYISSQPAVCDYLNDYEIVYFVSDRPGGWGSYDIWYTVYNKTLKKYNKAVNAGGYLNSAGADITPYYDASSKTMYFSSDGQVGYGGFDIYRTNGALVEWLPPENLGRPINSNFNDIYYKKRKENESGFLVSNRDESIDLKNPNCCYDIFEYKLPEKKEININGIVAITNETDYTTDNGATRNKNEAFEKAKNKKVQLWMVSSVSGISVLMKRGVTDETGEYHFKDIEANRNYIVRIDDKTMLRKKLVFDTKDVFSDTTIQLDTIFLKPIPKKSLIVKNIYFEFGKANLTPDSKETIDKTIYQIMRANNEIIVEIGAHTDYLGKSDYNLKLSQKRAESVVEYLIHKGIEQSRLKPVGYGEDKPLVKSTTETGKDIPEAREKNRRIEFTIIDTRDDN
jgi:OmpA-OmpF porin, OOP family